MNRNRVAGTAKALVGRMKVKVGRAFGDRRMVVGGTAAAAVGAVQNAVGRLEDTAKRAGRAARRRAH